jgi:hypothetical protein
MGTFGVPHDVDHNIRPKLTPTPSDGALESYCCALKYVLS